MKYAHATILIALVLGAGCGPASTPSTQNGRTPVRVFLLLINTKQVAFYNWAEEEYEKRYPEIDIQVEQFPGTSLKDYEVKLRLMYASEQAPDIWSFRENELASYVEMGLLEPAPDTLCHFVRDQGINEMIREAPFFGDTCYGITQHAGWQILYYNLDHFAEAGLPHPPKDWAELLEYANRLTRTDEEGRITRTGLSLRKTGYKQGTAEKWLTFFYSAGGIPFNEEGTTSYFDSKAGQAAFQLYHDALNQHKIDAVYVDGDQRGFGQGNVSMFIREDHVIEWLAEYYPDINYRTAPIPSLDSTVASYSSGGAFPMVVSSSSLVKEEAWHFLQFLFEEAVYTQYARMVQAQPLYHYVADKPEFNEDTNLVIYANQAVYPPPKFAHDRYSLEVIGEYVERFSYGRIPLEEVTERMTHDINRRLVLK